MQVFGASVATGGELKFLQELTGGRVGNACESEQQMREQIQSVLHPPRPDRRLPERRREQREPFPFPVRLTPLEKNGDPIINETIVVIGRTLSELGFDFYHVKPLPYRRVIASFSAPNGRLIGMLMDLSWCRFGQHGFYDGGGRFLQSVPSPLAR